MGIIGIYLQCYRGDGKVNYSTLVFRSHCLSGVPRPQSMAPNYYALTVDSILRCIYGSVTSVQGVSSALLGLGRPLIDENRGTAPKVVVNGSRWCFIFEPMGAMTRRA